MIFLVVMDPSLRPTKKKYTGTRDMMATKPQRIQNSVIMEWLRMMKANDSGTSEISDTHMGYAGG
jgi:hypothetical protein